MAQVNLISPSGAAVSVPEEQVQAALSRGFRLESQEEGLARTKQEEFGDRDIAAAGAGFARGATFGLSDAALTETGLVAPETLAGLRDANPVVSGVSEVAGAVAPLFIPGGQVTAAGASARLGANIAGRVTAGTGSRILGTAVAGVAEGALYGVGSAISEAAIGNTDLTGEKLAGSVAFNALAGGAGGAGAGLLEKALARALGRGAGAAGEEAIEGAARLVDDVDGGPSAIARTDDALPAPLTPDAPGTPPGAQQAAGEAAGAVPPVDAQARPIGVQLEDMAGFAGDPNAGKKLENLVTANAERIKGMMNAFGLTMPTPEELVLKDLDYKKRAANLLRDKGLDEEAPRLLLEDARYAKAKTAPQKIELLETKRGEYLRDFTGALDELDAKSPGGAAVDMRDVRGAIEEGVLGRLRKFSNLNKGAIGKVEGLLEDVAKQGDNLTIKEAEEAKRAIDPYLRWDSPIKDDNVAMQAMRDARAVLNRKIGESAHLVAEVTGETGLAERFIQGKRNFGAITELLEEGEERLIDARIANRVFSLTDNIAGAAGGAAALVVGGPGGIALAATGAIVNKWFRERMPHVLAVQLYKLRQSPAAQRASVGLHRSITSKLDDAARALPEGPGFRALPDGSPPGAGGMPPPGGPPAPGGPMGELAQFVQTGQPFGPYSETLRRASAQGPEALWAVHAALWGADDAYRHTMSEAGVASMEPSGDGPERRGRGLDAIEAATSKADARAAAAVDGLLAGKSRTPRAPRLQGDDWRVLSDRLVQLATQPEVLAEHLARGTVNLGEVAPETSAAVIAAAQRGVQYLAKAAPKAPPNPLDIPALGRTWSPTEQQRASFERKLSAVQDPYSVLEDMAGGTVTRDAVEALQTVYPALYEDTKAKLLERLASHGKPLPYAQRLSLGLLFGAPLDASMRPEMLAALQASYQQPEPSQRPRFGGGGGGPSEMAAAGMTATERLMGRRQ